MHFFKSVLATTLSLSAGVAAAGEYTIYVNTTASGLDINNIGLTSLVSYANSSIWIGGIKSQIYSEPFLAQGETGFYFTSWHSVPTGGVTAFIFPNETQPVGFTMPHSGSVPLNASTVGFSFGSNDADALTFEGTNKFIGCQPLGVPATLETYKIYWAGEGAPPGLNCTGLLQLYKGSSGCSTVG